MAMPVALISKTFKLRYSNSQYIFTIWFVQLL